MSQSFYHFIPGKNFQVGLVADKDRIVKTWVGTSTKKEFINKVRRKFPDILPLKANHPLYKVSEDQFKAHHKEGLIDLSRIPHTLDKNISPLAKAVYRELKKVKAGEFITYDELGKRTGLNYSAQAIGQIVGKNPLPLIIPCHRVVGKNGPGGFSADGGLGTKEKILNVEGQSLNHLSPRSVFDKDIDSNYIKRDLLKKEPRFKHIIAKADFFQTRDRVPVAPYTSLSSAVVSQQLSLSAAKTIYNRLLSSQNKGKNLDPNWVAKQSLQELCFHGVSQAKANTLKELAQWELEKKLPSLSQIKKMPDFMITRQLSEIKGIGSWTVEMYLIFGLGRLNVISPGDLGLRRGLEILTKKPISHNNELLTRTLHWGPYRSIGSWYLWRLLE